MTYQQEKNRFQQDGRLKTLTGQQAWTRNNWPDGCGVYLIWRVHAGGGRQLLYIGKAGKYCRTNHGAATMNGGNFAARLARWTPYCFQQEGPYAEYFEYGPRFRGQQLLHTQYEARYQHHVPEAEIEVECFCLSGWEQNLSPALLEANLLQEYLIEHNDLPVANNEL